MKENGSFMYVLKKYLYFVALVMCISFTAMATTINWYNNGTIYATTNCESGDDVILPTPPSIPGQVFLGWGKYQEIEYIEFNGLQQYIDTGIIPNPNTKFRVKLNMSQTTGHVIIGYVYTNNSAHYRLFNYNQQIYVDIGASSVPPRINGSHFYNYTTYDFLVGTQYVKDYTTNTVLLGQERVQSSFANDTIKINAPNTSIYGKIYLLQIWDSDTLVRDLVPAIDPYGTVCMYDKVSEQFFYNQGSDDLIAGPLVQQ